MKGSQALDLERPARFRGRKWIVASQVALSLVLLVAAGLLLRSFAKLATLDIGFDRSNVLLVRTDLKTAKIAPHQQPATYEQIESQLVALPGGVTLTLQPSGNVWSYKNLQGDTTVTANVTVRAAAAINSIA